MFLVMRFFVSGQFLHVFERIASKSTEFSFLGAITSFHFIITLVLTVKILTSLQGITEKIQGKSFDI